MRPTRPGIRIALQELERGRGDALVVAKIDRLSRSMRTSPLFPDARPGLLADDVLFTLRGDELEVTGEMESGNPGVVALDPSGAIKRTGEVVPPPSPSEAAMN